MDSLGTRRNKGIHDDTLPWYKEGLRFECQRCGRCCRGEPGVVWVNKREVEKISSFLGITQNAFAKNYLRSINDRFSLLEYGNGNCIMYDNGCKIYDVRPCQCRSFPFMGSHRQGHFEGLFRACKDQVSLTIFCTPGQPTGRTT